MIRAFEPKGPDMLPYVKQIAPKKMLAAALALAIATIPAAPALAWGRNEQNFLKGVAAALIVQAIIKDAKHAHATPAPQPTPKPQPQPVSIHRTTVAQAFQSYSSGERRLIQRSLRQYGYYSGAADGAFGPGTYNAVVAYARDQGMTSYLKTTDGTYGVLDSLIY
jgi:hypothetical protein